MEVLPLVLVFTTHLVYQAASEVYIDGSKALKRDAGDGVAYANFAAHKFRYLNLAPLVSTSVKEPRECGKLCVDHSSCFSTNLAAFRDQDRRIMCELLPSDKYNNSNKFIGNQTFHHLSMKSPCSSDPCMNQATCVAKYENNDYQCACLPGFVGKHCQMGFTAHLVNQAASDVYIDGSKALKRDAGDGVAYANFAAHEFRYLNLAPLVSTSVKEFQECNKLCVDHSSCFSTNLAAFCDQDGRIICELLPSDKYNNSNKFIDNATFHHFSIKSPCSSDPCLNQGTCVAKYENKDYQCACAVGYAGKHCEIAQPVDCQDIKNRGLSKGDGLYWLDPDAGSYSNAFLAYCDMTSYNGGWTMCYTTDEYVKPKIEIVYNALFPYASAGYRTDCNNIPFTEIIFVDHQTGDKAYFNRRVNQPITVTVNYGNAASTYGLWDGVGAVDNAYSYQLLICDDSHYSGFLISGFTNDCYKECGGWCGDSVSPYFRTAAYPSDLSGVAFNVNGHSPRSNKPISVGLR